MIITLKGADFSLSNIGTLTTCRISTSLGTGATYNGPTTVDKGAALNSTVTVADGYEVSLKDIIITMGGSTITDVITLEDNVITISISEVTGNVFIKVITTNSSTTPAKPLPI